MMIFAVFAPLFLLLVPSNIVGTVLSLAVFLVIGKLTGRRREKTAFKNEKTATGWGSAAGTVFSAAILGYAFYIRWTPSGSAAAIADMVGVSVQTVVGLLALLRACAAVWCMRSMRSLLFDTTGVLETGADLPDLSAKPDWADCTAAKLDRSDWLLCAAVALCGAIVFFDTCPLAGKHPDVDSSVFLYIGREMLRGKIPYVDLFDHKGVILYLIQCVGLLLSPPGTYFGVWLVEWAGLFVTAVFMYKTMRLLAASKVTSYLVLLIIVFTYANVYCGGGNFAEEYALPWIAAAVYIYLKFFMTLRYRSAEVVILGVGCGIVAFLRANMIGIWIAFTPLVIFFLLRNRKFKEILHCIGCFAAGLAVVCIPLGIYFVLTDSLDSMIKYYIQFNMSYTEDKASVLNQLNAMLSIGSGAHIAAVIFAALTYKYVEFKKVFWINMWGLAASLIFAAMGGRAYDHYGLILLPLLVIPVCCSIRVAVHRMEQANAFQENTRIGRMFRSRRTAAVAVGLVVLIAAAPVAIQASTYKPDPAVKYLVEETDESNDVLIVGNRVYYYLESDRKTDNRFFYQFPPIDVSDGLYEEFMAELDRNPSDCIILYTEEYTAGKLKDRLDQWRQDGVYVCEDLGSFAVYRVQPLQD